MVRVERWNHESDGEPTERRMREKLEALGYSVNTYTYPPGTRFETHTHGVDKIDGVLSGRFRIEMAGEALILEAGDLIWVPKGAPHSAEVMGDDPVVSLDAVRRG